MTPPPPGCADRRGLGPADRDQALGRHRGDRQLAHAEHRLELVGRGLLADLDARGASGSVTPRTRLVDPGRARDALLEQVAVVAAGDAVDDLDEHPVRRLGVVLGGRVGLPVESPLRHPRDATVARAPCPAMPIGAYGNPDVCSITCSTVMTSLPFGANSGM